MIETSELETLINNLSHQDESERRMAAERLGKSDARAIPSLIHALEDESRGVQDAAMRSLISISGEAAVSGVLPLLRQGPYLRNTARVIIREIGSLAVPLLRPLLSDKDDDIRIFCLDLITNIGICGYPDDIITLLRQDPNANVRAAAARCLGRLRLSNALPALIAALKDEEWVVFAVIAALAEIRDESCVVHIGDALNHASATVRFAAAEALGKMGFASAGPLLSAQLQEAKGPERAAVIKALVQLGLAGSIPNVSGLLINMLQKGDWEERMIALKGIVDIRMEQAIPLIVDMAGSLDPSDPSAEEMLGAIQETVSAFGCAGLLIDCLRNPSIKYRGKIFSINMAAALDCKDAVPAIIPLLGARSVPVVLAAVDGIARLCGCGAPAILSHLRTHEDKDVRDRVEAVLERLW